jgi:hypothetical protein
MAPYLHDGDEQDTVTFAVPLQADEDGLVGRECPQEECEPKYFKIAPPAESQGPAPRSLWCPYCGCRAGIDLFTTADQRELLHSMIFRDMAQQFQNMHRRAFASSRSLRYIPGQLPPRRECEEAELWRIVDCQDCIHRYAVHGPAPWCPICGAGALALHLRTEVQSIAARLSDSPPGREAQRRHLADRLRDTVTLFESFMFLAYAQALLSAVPSDQRAHRLDNLGPAFQNVSRAERIFHNELNWELFGETPETDRRHLEVQIAKRHPLTHRLGMVDRRFLNQVPSEQRVGEEVAIDAAEIRRLLEIVQAVLLRSISRFNRSFVSP